MAEKEAENKLATKPTTVCETSADIENNANQCERDTQTETFAASRSFTEQLDQTVDVQDPEVVSGCVREDKQDVNACYPEALEWDDTFTLCGDLLDDQPGTRLAYISTYYHSY